MKSCFDPSFKYVPSHETNIRKTFDRIRRQMEQPKPQPAPKVEQLPQRRKA